MKSEIEYFARRAREEASRARDGRIPAAASVHGSLAILYSARAFMLRAAEGELRDETSRVDA